MLCQILGMFATMKLARVLDPSGYGQFNIVQISASFGLVLAGLGLKQVVTRECARNPEKSRYIFFSSALLQTTAVLPTGVLIIFYYTYISNSFPLSMATISVILLYSMLLWQLLESLSFGHERMEFSAFISLVGSIIWVTFAWTAPKHFFTPFSTCLVFTLLQIVKAFGYFVSVHRADLLKKTDVVISYKYLLKNGLPFYWLALLTSATSQLPIFFLSQKVGVVEVGFYTAGLKFTMPMQMMVMTLMMSLYPGLSKISLVEPEKFLTILQRSVSSLIIIAALIASFVSLFRFELVSILFGKNFYNAGSALMLQIWYTSLLAVFNIIGITLAASDRQIWLAKLATAYTIISMPLLWIGAGYGATGLAFAMLISGIINITYHLYFFQISLPFRFSLSFYLILFGTLGSAMILSMSLSNELSFMIRIATWISIFGFISFITWATKLLSVPFWEKNNKNTNCKVD